MKHRSSGVLLLPVLVLVGLVTRPSSADACINGVDCRACYGFETADGFRGPWSPLPGVINVYWDPVPADIPNGNFGTQPGTMKAVEAEHLARMWFGAYHGDSGAPFRFKWVGTPDANMGQCTGESVAGRPPFIRISTAPVNNGSGQTFPYFVPGGHALNCVRIVFDPGMSWRYEGSTKSYTGAGDQPGDDFISLLNHEMGHAMRWAHAHDDQCNGFEMEDDDMGTGNGHTPVWSSWNMHKAEKTYLAYDYGRVSYHVHEVVNDGFTPVDWDEDYDWGQAPMSAVTATDGNDLYSGYAYNQWLAGAQLPIASALFVEAVTVQETFDESWHRPDITRTINRATNQWLLAQLVDDTPEERLAQIAVWERNFNGGAWERHEEVVDSPFNHVATTYDPIAQKYYLTWLDDMMTVRLRHRAAASMGQAFADVPTLPDFASSGGADIACSQYTGTSGLNCLMVYVENKGNARPVVRFRRFGYVAGQFVFENEASLGVYGYTRPSITVNPVNADPQFLIALDQGTGTVYMRMIPRSGNTVSGAQYYAPPSSTDWLRPAGLGTWRSGGVTHVDLMVAR